MKFVYFDLGLSKKELAFVTKFCNCEVRAFPVHMYPPFVSNLFNYAWKPIIIYTMLAEFNFVMWADASLNFFGSKNATYNFFKAAKEVGILGSKRPNEFSTFYYTKKETFLYLNESPCLFSLGEIGAGLITIWKTAFTWRYIVQPWLACALTENCMSHQNPKSLLKCKPKIDSLHRCHRLDQSVLGIILQRLFNRNLGIVDLNRIPPIGRVNRSQRLPLEESILT